MSSTKGDVNTRNHGLQLNCLGFGFGLNFTVLMLSYKYAIVCCSILRLQPMEFDVYSKKQH